MWAYILDTTRVNLQTLLSLTNPGKYGMKKTAKNEVPRISSFDFGVELALALIMPWVNTRPLMGLPSFVKNAAYNVSENPRFLHTGAPAGTSSNALTFPHDASAGNANKRECRDCLAEIQGKGYRKERKKVCSVTSLCQICGRFVCRKKHLKQICLTRCIPAIKDS